MAATRPYDGPSSLTPLPPNVVPIQGSSGDKLITISRSMAFERTSEGVRYAEHCTSHPEASSADSAAPWKLAAGGLLFAILVGAIALPSLFQQWQSAQLIEARMEAAANATEIERIKECVR